MKAGGVSRGSHPVPLRRRRGGGPFLAAGILFAVCVFPASGCAPARYRIAGEEARDAAVFFASAANVPFPIQASFSGIAEISGRTVPVIAGLHSRTASDEILGFYDPLGRAVLFLANDGKRVSMTRGPAADGFPPGNPGPLAAGPVSLGRILSGAPGYPVAGGEAGRTADGRWVLAEGSQTLFSDPSLRLLSRAEYRVAGKRVTVTYPGRESPGPPRTVTVEMLGNRITLRRDEE